MTAASPIDVGALIDEAPLRRFQGLVFLLCLAVSMFDGFDIQALAFAAAAIGRELHLGPDRLGLIFSATLLGAVAGAYLGALADRIGRRTPILIAVALFGTMTLACVFASGFWSLLACRFVAGIGLGGAVPNMIALTAEYAPRRIRATAVTIILWGFPLGALGGALVSSWLIGAGGWRAIFLAGAVAPLLLLPAMALWLPESARFLALRRPGDPRLARLLARLDPTLAGAPILVAAQDEGVAPRRFTDLFRGGLATGSILLAAASFTSLLLMYLMTSWVPLLLERSGLSAAMAILGSAVVNGGSLIGSYALARRAATAAPLKGIALFYLLGAVAVLATAVAATNAPATFVLLGLFGCCHVGAQIAITNHVANWYPTALRGSGIAWVGAVGRAGSLVGPLLGGRLIASGLGLGGVFAIAAVAGFATAGLILALAVRKPGAVPA